MKWVSTSIALLSVTGGAVFAACGSSGDTAPPPGAGDTGGTTSPGGFAGSPATNVGGSRTLGAGGRGNTAGGLDSGIGGSAMAGFTAVDLGCVTGGNCTSDCNASCPGSSTISYSCTCSGGQLTCDFAACTAAITGTTCASGTADGTVCNSATDTTCTPTSGANLCVCSAQSNQWACF